MAFQPYTNQFLHLACAGELSAAEALLGAHPEVVTDRDDCGETALHWLAIENESDAVRLLLRHGADPNSRDAFGVPVVSHVAGLGLLDLVRTLVEAGADVNAAGHTDGESALHRAARHSDDLSVIDFLCDAGANIEARDELGATPLWHAVVAERIEAVRRLLRRGADVRTTTNSLDTALHRVVGSPMNVELLELLLASGADIDARNDSGCTPLHHAVLLEYGDALDHLLKRGASPSSSDGCNSILETAAAHAQASVVRKLIAAGANLRPEPEKSGSVLHAAAAMTRDPEVIDVLIDAGIHVDESEAGDETPLLCALRNSNVIAAERLLARGADPRRCGRWLRDTALHLAAALPGSADLVDPLISAGAELDALNHEGRTPLEVALRLGNTAVAERLTAHSSR